jgi:hypothetical protein
MANQNQPSGLAPVRYRNGSPWNGAVNFYSIAAADTNAYWIGDPVSTLVSTAGTPGGDSFGIPNVTLWAGATVPVRGVIVAIGTNPQGGPFINPNNLTQIYRPSGAAAVPYYVAVVDDPEVLFEIQEAGVHAVLTAASISRNVSLNTGTRSGTLLLSPTYLDNNTVSTTATLQLKIQAAIQRADNTPFTQYQKWLVSINNHEFSAGTASL